MSDCIEHIQKGDRWGYGHTNREGKHVALHRAVFFDEHGYYPEVVRHTCDNSRCINIDHLIGGTQADNMADMVSRGRAQRVCKLTDLDVEAIRSSNLTTNQLALVYSISTSHINRIKKRVSR